MEEGLERLRTQHEDEAELRTGLSYGGEDPVVVRVHRRDQQFDLDDAGTAVRLAGEPDGWTDVADGLMKAHGMSVDGDGVVTLRAVQDRDLAAMALSVADTSLALYAALRDTGAEVGFDSDTGVE